MARHSTACDAMSGNRTIAGLRDDAQVSGRQLVEPWIKVDAAQAVLHRDTEQHVAPGSDHAAGPRHDDERGRA